MASQALISPCPTILQQPVECLDTIALEVDTTKDLLSLALTCKALHALDLLARDKTLARSVRVLKLQPIVSTDPRFLIPLEKDDVSIRPKVPKSQRAPRRSPYELLADVVENHFAPALGNMTRLHTFSWREENKRYIFRDPMDTARTFDKQDVLGKLLQGKSYQSTSERESDFLLQNVRVESLTEFFWASHESSGSEASDGILQGVDFPNIESFSMRLLGWGRPKWQNAFKHFQWPRIRHLEISGRMVDGEGIISDFLRRHPSLETLNYDLMTITGPSFDRQILPNLQVLRTTMNSLVELLEVILSPTIHTVTITRGHPAFAIRLSMEAMADALRSHPSITHVNFRPIRTHHNYGLLAEALPSLQSVNGVSFTGDAEALTREVRSLVTGSLENDVENIVGFLSEL
ncbi:hypothetical protein DL93DRAFT_2174191 [Clavulina sp. PMI_390]|nr:hypothetical protein DL93DRAFT_2174191 [Clavulina sp. PMI_390]